MGTSLAIVWPSISTTSRGRLDMDASSDRVSQGYPLVFKEPCIRSRRRPRAVSNRRDRDQYCIVRKALIPNLLCSRAAGSRDVYAVELTALKLSDLRVGRWSRCWERQRDQTSVDQPRVPMEPPMKNLIARFVRDESGATAIEYGLIAAGISLAIIAVVNGLGTNLNAKFTSINSSLK